MQPWKLIERVATREGSLELRQRGAGTFIITIRGRVLMTSDAHRSEIQLADAALAHEPRARVLLGGLGMGFTLRAALDRLPPAARVTVVDINPAVVAWCRGPLAPLTKNALADRRVTTVVGDVARAIADARPGAYDAIVLDLYEGPHQVNNRATDPLYGAAALARTAEALGPGGVLAIWSEEADAAFEARMAVLFDLERQRGASGGRKHVIYVGQKSGKKVARRGT